MSLGLPRLLRTAFELKMKTPASTNEPDAATLTLPALNVLRDPKHQNSFSICSNNSKFQQLANLGGLQL